MLCPFDLSQTLYRLDVWERDAPWSAVKQLRTVVETEYSVDDVFDTILRHFHVEGGLTDYYANKGHKSDAVKMAAGSQYYLLLVQEQNIASCLQYREIPLPWYVIFCASAVNF